MAHMPVFDLFSKRKKKRERAGERDVFGYDKLPKEFRVQVAHIWRTALPPIPVLRRWGPEHGEIKPWDKIHETMSRERSVFALPEPGDDPFRSCVDFLMSSETDHALDIIELSFRWIEQMREFDPEYGRHAVVTQEPDDAIDELNQRFREHGIGYEYLGGEIVRKDSEYVHREVIKPAVSLLHEHRFSGASDEFMRAHKHYRNGAYKEAIQESLKSFESTMKTICDRRRWVYSKGDTAKALIKIMFEKGLLSDSLKSHFASLRTLMESGLPTVRNRMSGHGQGASPVTVPRHLAAYALHLAGANIVFLIESDKAMK